MSFWESKPGAILGLLLLAWVLVVSAAGVRVHLATHPPRQDGEAFDFESLLIRAHRVQFSSADGIRLSGWLLPGETGRAPILLCHDAGDSKATLLPVAIELHHRGYPTLLFDFRGHGSSEGQATTLGVTEKRDILGALDYLAAREGAEPPQIGLYAVGMGAHAAVLAAADRPSLRVLVLDRLYPDVSYPLAETVFAGWDPGTRHLRFLSDGLFALMRRVRIGEHRAADAMPVLRDRDLLLLAPEDDPLLVAEMQRMVEAVPDHPDADPSLVVVPPSGRGVPDAGRYHDRIAGFFDERLGVATRAVHQPL